MIWLVGENGMLGKQIALELKKNHLDYHGSDLEVDICDYASLKKFTEGKRIAWIINCAAYTAVDRAESEEKKAGDINALGAGNLGRLANELDAKIIHFSTDYVFDGESEKPYMEDDLPNPKSVYGKTKLEGERGVSEASKCFIIRISWLYGVHGPNFVKTMLRLFGERERVSIVADQMGAPTYCKVLAENVIDLIRKDSGEFGIYHYSDQGEISWYDFSCEIKQQAVISGLSDGRVDLVPISTEEYPTEAARPKNSMFDKSKIVDTLGFRVVDWKANLELFFKELEEVNAHL